MREEIAAREQQIIEEFALFADWSERYQYLIDLGKSLRDFPDSERVPANLLTACQSQVFVVVDGSAASVRIRAVSDSSIVSGLIALVLRVLNALPAKDIVQAQLGFIEAIGLGKNLSMTRKNGLQALIALIKSSAASLLADAS
jgi:cysteine desulfuration protein SufE